MLIFNGQEVTLELIRGACKIMLSLNLPIHARSDIADALSAFLPNTSVDGDERRQGQDLRFQRERAFFEFSNNDSDLNTLIRAAIQVYNDCEKAGDYHVADKRRPLYQFFQYFNTNDRCDNEIANIAREAKNEYLENSDKLPLFLHFQTKLFQDANEFMTEGLGDLETLKKLKHDLENLTVEEGENEEEKTQELKKQIDQKKNNIRWSLSNSKLCLNLILKLSNKTDIISVFLLNSTNIEQIAGMINLYIDLLANREKRKNYRVGDQAYLAKLQFKPKSMICQLCLILINLIINNEDSDSKQKFLKEIVGDSRSFNLNVYKDAKELFENFSYQETGIELDIGTVQRDQFSKVLEIIIQTNEELKSGDLLIDYDDAPEEFLDAVMFTLMDDPVMLPTSKNIMDRGCIVRQLLTKEEDPFNRAPLTVADLKPLPELKSRIENYKKEKMNEAMKRRNEIQSSKSKNKDDEDLMETSSQAD